MLLSVFFFFFNGLLSGWIILIIYKIGYNRTSGQPKGNHLNDSRLHEAAVEARISFNTIGIDAMTIRINIHNKASKERE